MKKLLSSVFTLMLFASMANATTFKSVEVKKDCHAVACQAIADNESFQDVDEDFAEFIYDVTYNSCTGNKK